MQTSVSKLEKSLSATENWINSTQFTMVILEYLYSNA